MQPDGSLLTPAEQQSLDAIRQRHFEVMQAVGRETDRGAPLVVAELLSDDLEDLLRAAFKKNGLSGELQKKLLKGFTAPISSFAMRTTMCRAFGILPPAVCDALDTIREIRNHCAHSKKNASIHDDEVKAHTKKLQSFCQEVMKANCDVRGALHSTAGYLAGHISVQTAMIIAGVFPMMTGGMLQVGPPAAGSPTGSVPSQEPDSASHSSDWRTPSADSQSPQERPANQGRTGSHGRRQAKSRKPGNQG